MCADAALSGTIERRLRSLAAICAALAAGVLADAALIAGLVGREEQGEWATSPSPPVESLFFGVGAMLVILLSTAVHGRILRRAVEREAEAREAEGREAEEGEAAVASGEDRISVRLDRALTRGGRERRTQARLRAYFRATLASFAMLEAAAAVGLAVALRSRSSFYGLVVCATSLAAMMARWPREGSLERLLAAEIRG